MLSFWRYAKLLCVCCALACAISACWAEPAEVESRQSALTYPPGCNSGNTAVINPNAPGTYHSEPQDTFVWFDGVHNGPVVITTTSGNWSFTWAGASWPDYWYFSRTDTAPVGHKFVNCTGTLHVSVVTSCPRAPDPVYGACLTGCQQMWNTIAGSCAWSNGEVTNVGDADNYFRFVRAAGTYSKLLVDGQLEPTSSAPWYADYFKPNGVGLPYYANIIEQ